MIKASPSLVGYIERSNLSMVNACDRFIAGIATYLAVQSWLDYFENEQCRHLPPGCEILSVAAIPNRQAVNHAFFLAGGMVATNKLINTTSLAVTLAAAFRHMWPDEDRDAWIHGHWTVELGWYLAAEAEGSGMCWDDDDDRPPHGLELPSLVGGGGEDFFVIGTDTCSDGAAMKTKVILVGPGGSGKDYLAKLLVEKGYKRAVSCTTRPPRKGEVDGVDYHYISDKEFRRLINEDAFKEWYSFGADNWLYGTLNEEFEKCELFIMSPPVLATFRGLEEFTVIYLNIPMDIRRRRLELRADADSVGRRLVADAHDFCEFKRFNIEITNPSFTVDEVLAAIEDHRRALDGLE